MYPKCGYQQELKVEPVKSTRVLKSIRNDIMQGIGIKNYHKEMIQ
jgi:hypothetical protein